VTAAAVPAALRSSPPCGDAQDYKAFETAITAYYDAQSVIERELVLRLASLLWRLHRAATIETGLFEIQANHLTDVRQGSQFQPASRKKNCSARDRNRSCQALPSLQPATLRLWRA